MNAVYEELVGELNAVRALLNNTVSKLAAIRVAEKRPIIESQDRAVALPEAMEIPGLSRATIWREMKRGRLRRMQGGRVRFSLTELRRYMSAPGE